MPLACGQSRLPNTSRKLLAKAINATVERVVRSVVHPSQRGLLPARGMLPDAFEAFAPMRIFRFVMDAVPAVVLFDMRAAFPSVSWDWIWRQAISNPMSSAGSPLACPPQARHPGVSGGCAAAPLTRLLF